MGPHQTPGQWGYGPPSGAPGTLPVPTPKEAAAPPELPGVRHGVPLDKRGQIGFEAAAYTSTDPKQGSLDSVVAVGLNVRMPIATRTFADVRVPMASYFPGNIMLGVDRVGKLGERGFLGYGLQIGLPLSVQRGTQNFALPNGLWNMHEYQPNFLPIKVSFNYERLLGEKGTLRLDLEPIMSVPVGDHGFNVGWSFQHALEVQYGHDIGVGLRVQGIALSDQLSADAYQLAVEPFAVVQREIGFARLGLMLPIDGGQAGPPFEQSWGLRLWAGLHVD